MFGDIASLAVLENAKASPQIYFSPWLTSNDEVVRVGAWCGLLEREAVARNQYDQVLTLADYGAIHRRAFRFFESVWEHDYARRVAAITPYGEAAAAAHLMRAVLACDGDDIVLAQRDLFLAGGTLDSLVAMSSASESLGGWAQALEPAVTAVLLFPHDSLAAQHLLHLLYSARRADLLDEALGHLRKAGLHQFLTGLYEAARLYLVGEASACLGQLGKLGALPPPRRDLAAKIRYLPPLLAANCQERLGNYRRAFDAFLEMHRVEASPNIKLDDFGTAIRAAAALQVPALPDDTRYQHLIMTGFPRSGTTLLENILSAHPAIETFEEIPARAAMQFYIDSELPDAETEDDRRLVFVEARRRYYDEIDRRAKKLDASIFIDKMPMRSAEAVFMAKAFPQKRYIFSIRHPFDVVLSGLQQHFSPNIAMAHFQSFETAVGLYDFTMNQWFSTYTREDQRVHYLRYDDLVTEFDASVARVLSFLGVAWDDRVREFAQVASQRSARTPSYGKVRQGLSIGVQTAWRNYDFLFQSPAAKPLYRWAEFFGYPTR